MLIVGTKLCYACGSPNVGLEVSEDIFGFSLTNKYLAREKSYHDDVYCFCCSDYRRSADGYLVFHNGKLFTIREYFDDYEIVEVPYEQCGHVLFFGRFVIPVAQIPRYKNKTIEQIVEEFLPMVASR